MQRGWESLRKYMKQENENLGSTDKDWKRCCVSIVNGSLNINYKCCSMRTIFSQVTMSIQIYEYNY